ncbi:MAG TPA: hypothetical protein VNZ94_00550 [Xanthobacteraceae bacterium]|nr:hypothetical protein [Xanthobacteraceae bacterium]
MSHDPAYRLALDALRLSIDVEAQITSKAKSEPLLIVLHKFKENAAAAMTGLIDVDPEDPKKIRQLQNEVTRFLDVATWLNDMLMAGPEAEHTINEAQRREAESYVVDDADKQKLGIPTEGETHAYDD